MVVEVIPSDAEWFDAQLDMQNDGRNAVWDVWCGMECAGAVGSVMCILYLNVAMCMVECGHVKWCADTVVESRDLR